MEPFLGQVMLFAGNFAPRGWAFCDGQLLSIAENEALFSLLGTIYGGDGRTDFALPDLRGRSPIGPGQSPGLSNIQEGQKTGVESVFLTVNELPSHSHAVTATTTINASKVLGNKKKPGEFILAKTGTEKIYSDQAADTTLNDGSATTTVTVGNTGGGQSVFTRSPALGMHWIIALEGAYPPRD